MATRPPGFGPETGRPLLGRALDGRISARLLRFLINHAATLEPEAADDWLGQFTVRTAPGRPDIQVPHLQICRAYALMLERDDAIEESAELWEKFGILLQQFELLTPTLEAALKTHIGDLYARRDYGTDNSLTGFLSSFGRKPSPYDSENAENHYLETLELEPDNLEISLKLARLYEHSGSKYKAKLNRLLDRLCRDFPDNSRVLEMAGQRCLEREAYLKGLKYLHRAAELDPTNPQICENIIIGSIKLAWKAAREGKRKKLEQILAKILPLARAGRRDFNLSPALLQARWAVMARRLEDTAAAAAWLEEAYHSDSSFSREEIDCFHDLYLLVGQFFGRLRKQTEKRLKAQLKKLSGRGFAALFPLTEIIDYLSPLDKAGIHLETQRQELAKKLLAAARRQPVEKELRALLGFLHNYPNELCSEIDRTRQLAHRHFPDSLFFQLLQLADKLQQNICDHKARRLADEIADLAERIEDTEDNESRELVRRLLERIEQFETLCSSFGPIIDEEDFEDFEDEEFEDEEDFDEYDPEDGIEPEPVPPLPPGCRNPPKSWPRRRRRRR